MLWGGKFSSRYQNVIKDNAPTFPGDFPVKWKQRADFLLIYRIAIKSSLMTEPNSNVIILQLLILTDCVESIFLKITFFSLNRCMNWLEK